MIGHLGSRISALLDGQLSAEETERAWAHALECHFCRDEVEREGWVKTSLAGLSFTAATPDHIKGSLLGAPPENAYLAIAQLSGSPDRRRSAGFVALGGGAVGVAVLGVLALGAAPADAPTIERRAPVANLVSPSGGPAVVPTRRNLP